MAAAAFFFFLKTMGYLFKHFTIKGVQAANDKEKLKELTKQRENY
jgi:hypothetical protein